MIEKLTVKDIAVVEAADIAFGPGLNVVTGETGAGKSVLIGAIGLLCGGRAEHGLVRQGAQQSTVTAEIALPAEAEAAIAPILEDAGIDACEDGRLILRRTVSATGSGRSLVNNCPATLQTLLRIGEHLVDLHGPHDNQSLFNPAFQLDALDAFGRCRPLRDAFAALWRERRALQQQREALAGEGDAVARELDLLQYQIKEIAEAELSPDTDGEALAAEHAESANAATLLELGGAVLQGLAEGEGSIIDTLANVIRGFEEMKRHGSAEAAAWAAEAKSASIQINELAKSVASSLSRIDASPERLQWLEDRMALVEKLKRKYGGTVENVLARLERAQTRAAEIAGRAGRIAELDAQIAAASQRLDAGAAKLTAARTQASGELGAAVSAQLADLGLPHAAFQVDVAPADADRDSGRDAVEFGFAPNPGEPRRPLRNIASSGEISRVMLALKTVLAEHDTIPVLVFDEIDANIGGEIANVVGAKLADVAKLHQVICITHLPQVAAWGRSHFAVTKHIEDGRTSTRINPVAADARVHEIARMLGGADLTSVTLAHAGELLLRSRNKA
ncbi:MAG: DNA repair protein RecN [Kiritimatiellia bacterium]|jgi:DNA repair protein RecN (Recombination protein N)